MRGLPDTAPRVGSGSTHRTVLSALVVSGTQDGLMAVRRFLDAARGGLYMPPNSLDAAFTPYEDSDIVIS